MWEHDTVATPAEEAVTSAAVNSDAEEAAASVSVSQAPASIDSEPVRSPTPEQVNARNAATTTGRITDDGQGAAFFTSADVRAMSREQVRANLSKILKSMESPEF